MQLVDKETEEDIKSFIIIIDRMKDMYLYTLEPATKVFFTFFKVVADLSMIEIYRYLLLLYAVISTSNSCLLNVGIQHHHNSVTTNEK